MINFQNVGQLHAQHVVADGECIGHMNHKLFVFPDSNPTRNPNSGGTHSWWSEGKLGLFIPFSHHRHIMSLQNRECHTNLTKHFTELKSACPCFQQHRCLFPVICYLTDISWPQSMGEVFGKTISALQIFTVHARGADTCITGSFDHLHEKQVEPLSSEGSLDILSTWSSPQPHSVVYWQRQIEDTFQ